MADSSVPLGGLSRVAASSFGTPCPLIEICCESSLFRDLSAGLSVRFDVLKAVEVLVAAAAVVWVGIDAGKARHHAVAVESDGGVLWSMKVVKRR